MDSELLNFTSRALGAGVARTEIEKVLKTAGWPDSEIASALGSFAELAFPVPVPKPKSHGSPSEILFYIVMFTTLYISAAYLCNIIFHFIDFTWRDPRESLMRTDDFYYSEIREDIAALIVALPPFLVMFGLDSRAIRRNPTRRSSQPRKWMTYLTLLIALGALIWEVGALVYNVLGADFTTRFALKIVTGAVIAGGIFSYFLLDIRRDAAR